MSKGLGHIERAIAAIIEDDRTGRYSQGEPRPVCIRTRDVFYRAFPERSHPPGWTTGQAIARHSLLPVERKAIVRALNSFVRKHQQYTLSGGKGRMELILYDTADPVAVMLARLRIERGGFVSSNEARSALAAQEAVA